MKITLALLLTATLAYSQGGLAPPAAPAPTMKTLAQVEARTPIPPSPAVPIAGPHFTISQPGSYYLTGNITVADGNGILITAASDVSLDLNGYSIGSTLTGRQNGNAIGCSSDITRLTVQNGSLVSGSNPPATLQGFRNGIASSAFISEASIRHLHISGMASRGLFLDNHCLVENCTATNNGEYGIYAYDSIVTHCIVTQNGGIGIDASRGIITHCSAAFNSGHGIYASPGSVTNSIALSNGDHGIFAPGGAVASCRANLNFKNGIHVGLGVAAHCVASGNSTNASTVDKQIEVTASGQRDACVPATE